MGVGDWQARFQRSDNSSQRRYEHELHTQCQIGQAGRFQECAVSGSGARRRARRRRRRVRAWPRARRSSRRRSTASPPKGSPRSRRCSGRKRPDRPPSRKSIPSCSTRGACSRGCPWPPACRRSKSTFPYAADGHVIVDVKANGTHHRVCWRSSTASPANWSKTSPGDLQLHVDLDQIEAIAAQPDVLFVQPRAGGVHVTRRRPPRTGRLTAGRIAARRGAASRRPQGT